MPKAKLKNEAWRPLYNKQAARIRKLVAYVNRWPADEWAPTMRLAIEELRVFVACIKADMRPTPPMPHVQRLVKLSDDEMDQETMEWNDRMERLKMEQSK